MKQYIFTAEEMYCMAYLMNKREMYGIPNTFIKNDKSRAMQIVDHLLERHIVNMNMDGKAFVDEGYHELVLAVCECNKCAKVELIKEGKHITYIWWKYGNQYWMAELNNEKYMFSNVDEDIIQALFDLLKRRENAVTSDTKTSIPLNVLKKIQKSCMDNRLDDAIQLLRQYGMPERVALSVVNGLTEQSQFVSVIYMNNKNKQIVTMIKQVYYVSHSVCLRLTQDVQNLRTCIVFTEITCSEMNQVIKSIADSFCRKEQE